jgi:hypothetical protein
LVTWVYDEIGCPGAILDDFSIRNLSGNTVGWVFGLSMFSLKGEHIGWYQDGAFFDIENNVLGFIPGAPGLLLEPPALAAEPPLPVLSKRPCVPALRGRTARPAGQGWSTFCLATYLSFTGLPSTRTPFIPRAQGGGHELLL